MEAVSRAFSRCQHKFSSVMTQIKFFKRMCRIVLENEEERGGSVNKVVPVLLGSLTAKTEATKTDSG